MNDWEHNALLRDPERRFEEHYTVAQIMAGICVIGLILWAVMVGSQVMF